MQPVLVTVDNFFGASDNKMIYLVVDHVNEPYVIVRNDSKFTHCQVLCRDTKGRRIFAKSCHKGDSLRIRTKGKKWLAQFIVGIAYVFINASSTNVSPGCVISIYMYMNDNQLILPCKNGKKISSHFCASWVTSCDSWSFPHMIDNHPLHFYKDGSRMAPSPNFPAWNA